MHYTPPDTPPSTSKRLSILAHSMLRNSPTLRIAPAPGNSHSNPSLFMCPAAACSHISAGASHVHSSACSMHHATAGADSRLTIRLTAVHAADYELINQKSCTGELLQDDQPHLILLVYVKVARNLKLSYHMWLTHEDMFTDCLHMWYSDPHVMAIKLRICARQSKAA